ncbi:MAG: alanine--glyoxylate aminotransferase family protein [Chloroflexi bacterium]|nr:alanine--glyoxylate aminotransferase family protein [Chloroflexota bacterium]
MYRPQNLRIPGPTFVPQSVLAASARPLINHRGPEFASLLAGLTRALQDFLRTQNDVLLLTSSGSGAMEAAVANTLARGDRVIVFSSGSFGERFHSIAKAYGVDARRVDVPWGRAVDPDLVRDELAKEKGKDGAKAVLVTHNETSTGVLNPLKEIAEVVRESGKLFLVDSISGAGAVEVEVDEWGIDVLVSASQKGWGAPPGVGIITMGPRAWKAYDRSDLPKAYFDQRSRAVRHRGPVVLDRGISTSVYPLVKEMAEEGIAAICQRHRDLAYATRRGVQALGLQLFADEAHASPTVTSFRSPTRVDARNLIRILRESYDTVIAGGQGRLEGQIGRIGHMGFVTLQDMVSFMSALELTMRDLHQPVEPGQAIAALLRAYDEATQPPPKAKPAAARLIGSRR